MVVLDLSSSLGCGTGRPSDGYNRVFSRVLHPAGGGEGRGGGGVAVVVAPRYQAPRSGRPRGLPTAGRWHRSSRLDHPLTCPTGRRHEASIADATQGFKRVLPVRGDGRRGRRSAPGRWWPNWARRLSAGSIEDSSVPIPGGEGNWKRVRAHRPARSSSISMRRDKANRRRWTASSRHGAACTRRATRVLLVWRVPSVLAGARLRQS